MTYLYIPANAPSYQILSSDIGSAGSAVGCTYTGAMALATDTGKWYRVLDDLILQEVILPTKEQGYIVSASFLGNGAEMAYHANSAVLKQGNGLVEIPNAFRGNGSTEYIKDITLITSASGITISPRIHFYSASDVTLAVDSGSWISLYNDEASMLDYYTLGALTSSAGSSTNMSMVSTIDSASLTHPNLLIQSRPNSRSLFFGLETRTAFTSTASQIWKLKLYLT